MAYSTRYVALFGSKISLPVPMEMNNSRLATVRFTESLTVGSACVEALMVTPSLALVVVLAV